MKPIASAIIFYFISLLGVFAQPKEELQINGSFKNLTFQEFVEKLESQYPLHFYYNEKWVSSLKVDMEAKQLPVTELMYRLFLPTSLDYIYQPPGTNLHIAP